MMSQILKFIDSLKHKNLNILGAKLGVILGQNCVWLSDAALDDFFFFSEAVVRKCCVKKVLLEILQISQENNRLRDSFLIKLQA